MKTIGIIAEFNPFHQGHAHLLEQARLASGADFCIVIMSGDFVQRGAPALVDKYRRTEMALAGGADLVLELPLAAACGSARRFAESAVSLLSALGVVDELWFGSEAGDLAPFTVAADILCDEPQAFKDLLQEYLRQGFAFPKARALALARMAEKEGRNALSGQDAAAADFLAGPNNILGLEYLLALRRQASAIRPATIRRSGAGYHDTAADKAGTAFLSAEAIRHMLLAGKPLPEGAVPAASRTILEAAAAKGAFLETDDFSDMLLYQLHRESADSLTAYADVDQELADRILNLRSQFVSFTQFAGLLKTKNRTRSQIDRALLHILLNIRTEDMLAAQDPDYVRVLGFSSRAAGGEPSLLHEIRKRSQIVLVTKASDLSAFSYGTDLSASLLYEQLRMRKSGEKKAVHEYERPVLIFTSLHK